MLRAPFMPALAACLIACPVLAQPDNNFCATAQPVTEGLWVYDQTDAVNTSTGACDPAGVSPPEVWFDYTPAASGTASISTCGLSPYVPFLPNSLAAFADCSGPQITCAAGNCPGAQTEISFPVVQGQHYYVRVASVSSAFATGAITFRVIGTCTPTGGAPANDCCAGATPIGNGVTAFTTVNATRDYWSAYDIFVDNPDVWFNYAAPATGFVKFRPETDAPVDLAVAILDGSCSGNEIACDCDNLVGIGVRQRVFATIAGHHYLIRVRGISFDPEQVFVSGHFSITPATPPPNDDCSTALPISGLGVFNYDNTLANNSGPDNQPMCDSFYGGRAIFQDVWFRWTSNLPAGQDAVVSTVESPQIETKLAVYNDNCNTGVPGGALDCNDFVSDLLQQSRITFTPTPGASYLIRVGTIPNEDNQLPPQGRPGFFEISSQPTCVVTAPPGAFIEPEACGQNTNGGCDTNQFTDIPCGTTTIFGTCPVGADNVSDQDFYRVMLPVPTHVTFSGIAEFPMILGIFNEDCGFVAGRPRTISPCDITADPLEADVRAGTYYFAVQSARPYSPCGGKNNYVVTVSIGACEASGQCCIHTGCSVLPHSACLGSGGAYGGDNTVCPPPGGNYTSSTCTDAFEDVSAGGTPGPACDDCGLLVPLGFNFWFYGHSYSSIHVSSNGFLTFDDNMFDGAVPPDRLPDPSASAVIAPWWTNLDPTMGGQIYTATLGVAPHRRFVAEWITVQNAGQFGSGVTFEAILFEGSNQIAFRYADVNFDVFPTIATTSPDATVAAYFAQPDPNSCTTLALTRTDNPCCRADFNYNASLEVQDIFDFLNAWFSGDPRADFNGGGLAVQDIFDFLNAWFSGC